MAVLSGTYVDINQSSNDRINHIVDNLLTPSLLSFRQIIVNDEQADYVGSDWWKCTYPQWNQTFPFVFSKNGGESITPSEYDYAGGRFKTDFTPVSGDSIQVTYCFNWFPTFVLSGYIYRAIDMINNSGQNSAPTEYTIDDAPTNWNGVITDIVFAMCMEKLILDYDLWYGRVIFAIGANELNEGGGGDIVSQLETLKANAEERAARSLDNERFKVGAHLALPTSIYYAAIRGAGGRYGKLRGWKVNKYR